MDNRITHFDIQADNAERAMDFYKKVFGWKFDLAMSKEKGGMMDYWLIMTGQGPGIDGGMSQRPAGEDASYHFDCTIQVADIDKAVEAIKANGGTITMAKNELKDVGWFAAAKDTEGNSFNLMQATGKMAKGQI